MIERSYEDKKRCIQQEFILSKKERKSVSLQKNTSNLFRHVGKTQSKKLDVRQFNRVISIDPKNNIAETEGMITYEDLVKETLKYSLLPAVVPELKSITIGGAFVGVGIEASSFRYGFVHETVEEIEVLTGDGSILTCTRDNEHRDLFFAFANSYGSLGYILKLKIRLIPAKAFVHLTHQKFTDPDTYFKTLNQHCAQKEKSDYVEGTIFDRNEMYITVGKFVDEAPYTSNYRYMNIYYRSIQKRTEDFLTASDFIWRWDPDWFWCSKVFGMQNTFLRFLFGKWMLNSTSYWKIRTLSTKNPLLRFILKLIEKPSESVVQDIAIPIERAPEFLDFLFQHIGIKPIWTCPYQSYQNKNPFSFIPLDPNRLYIDFGFWDAVPSDKPRGYYNRLLEQKAQELEGFKSLYSDSYYSEEEFWRIFSKTRFNELKKKYDPDQSFKTIYEKCVQKVTHEATS